MKKMLVLPIIIGSVILLSGCGEKKELPSDDKKDEQVKTIQYECARNETLTVLNNRLKTGENPKENAGDQDVAMNMSLARRYEFNESGDKLLSYYDISTYEYVFDYDMDTQKKYFLSSCDKMDKATYKSCDVTVEGNKIIVVDEVDLTSEMANLYLVSLTLESIKNNYAESTYVCK